MKIFLIIILTSLINLFSQAIKPETDPNLNQAEVKKEETKKENKFYLNLMNSWVTYEPVEARNALERNAPLGELSYNNTYSYLNNNQRIINPFRFGYIDNSRKLNYEYSQINVVLSDVFLNSFTQYNALLGSNFNLQNIERTDRKFNVFKTFELNESNILDLGVGYRNIFKNSYARPFLLNNSEEYTRFYGNGLSLFLGYKFNITENIFTTLRVEPFYTYGVVKRNSYSPVAIGYDYRINFMDSPRAYYFGSEIDLSLSYKISETFSLSFGGNLIYTKIRNESNRNIRVFYDRNGAVDQLNTINNLDPKYNYTKTTDHLYSYYIGINALF